MLPFSFCLSDIALVICCVSIMLTDSLRALELETSSPSDAKVAFLFFDIFYGIINSVLVQSYFLPCAKIIDKTRCIRCYQVYRVQRDVPGSSSLDALCLARTVLARVWKSQFDYD